ncbi:GNAT family N-acetyltransferase [Pseudoclavibacter sp. CFCC 13611]|uniref:GNAT family N-acetyltransferase n=1 Tax=Pseudoclavibacter sp. CFCC 13611 TaxID=2615178 RepID=UPI001CE3E98A|nr:GNAT family N-acetyltransferase [Pseudoclavibacter sp. CFCC 13611]
MNALSTPQPPAAVTPRSAIEIRTARRDELEAIGRLTFEGFGHALPGARQPDAQRRQLLLDAAGRAAQGDLLVADRRPHGEVPTSSTPVREQPALIGTASLLRPGARLTRQARTGEAELRLLAVLPEARGTGAGWSLMSEALRRARAWGVQALVLDTGPTNFTSQRLYHRLGFERRLERETKPASNGWPLAVFVYDFASTDPLLVRLARPEDFGDAAALWAQSPTADDSAAAHALARLAHEHELWVVEHRTTGRLVGAVLTHRPVLRQKKTASPAPLLTSHPRPVVVADVPDRLSVSTRIEAHLEWLRQVRDLLPFRA